MSRFDFHHWVDFPCTAAGRHEQGYSNVTGGDDAPAAMQRNAIVASAKIFRVIATFISLCHCCVEIKTGIQSHV